MADCAILYGSQTGNAQSIAENLYQLISPIHKSVLLTLNDAKSKHKEFKLLIIVCSTTGNGDTPENTEVWWRQIKMRSMPKDSFERVKFAVLGLGDTNYDKFCHMGKLIDKRLEELGGSRFLELHCADEATDMEEVVTQFTAAIIKYFSVDRSPSSEHISPDSTQEAKVDEQPNDSSSDLSIQTLSISTSSEEVTAGLLGAGELSRRLGLGIDFTRPPEAKSLPTLRPPVKTAIQIHPNKRLPSIADAAYYSEQLAKQEWSAAAPFRAGLSLARWLTSGSEEAPWDETGRRVLHMELDIAGAGFTHSPGDSIGVCCPNREELVRVVVERLRVSEREAGVDEDWAVAGGEGEPATTTLGELLRYRLDLSSVPKKAAVLTLASQCASISDKCAMEWQCSKDAAGKALWAALVEEQGVGVGELLALFPSCLPSLAVLVAVTPKMTPRFYSIASSPLVLETAVAIAFSVVQYTASAKDSAGNNLSPIRRTGLCTGYLQKLARRHLTAGASQETPKVRIFLKPSVDFHLPGNTSFPLILVGPGTGVAPFVGFLAHRQGLAAERNKRGCETSVGTWRGNFTLDAGDLPSEPSRVGAFLGAMREGPVWLFFGCRGEQDYLYRDELRRLQDAKVLTSLHVAMSRVGPTKHYVTDSIREQGEQLADAIVNRNGRIYVCGDGNHMARDVFAAFKEILCKHSSGPAMDDKAAESFLAEMKKSKRYLQDVWS